MHSTPRYSVFALLVACVALTGCYQARMTTSNPAGDTVVEERWAPSYLGGLVPATIDVTDDCPSGIASAEREFTFPNMLVSALTLGIYLPQHVTVTCASGGTMSSALHAPDADVLLAPDATAEEANAALSDALRRAPGRTMLVVRVRTR